MENLRLKCEELLSFFKKKRRDEFVKYGYSTCDDHISKILSLSTRVDEMIVNELYGEFDSNIQTKLVETLQKEYDNLDRQTWYTNHFDNWKMMPERQDCEQYPMSDRLEYSKCRLTMFNHLEKEWKKQTFPNLHERLEFFWTFIHNPIGHHPQKVT